MRTFSLKLTISLLALAGAAVPAAAQDAKNYPGGMCLASGSAITRIERPSTGQATNLGPGTLTFQCPGVKDFGSLAGAVVYVTDGDPGDAVSCTLRSRDLAGNVDVETHASSISGFGSDPVPLVFSGMSGASFGYYLLTCTVPEPVVTTNGTLRSGVVMYQITEND